VGLSRCNCRVNGKPEEPVGSVEGRQPSSRGTSRVRRESQARICERLGVKLPGPTRQAYKAVKSNKGAAGVDGQMLEQFEADLKGNLYKIWNRMSSGSYFPPPVRAVSIPKKSGGERILGVPTVSDRIAQMVVKQLIEPDLEAIFLPDSYSHRPDKSALDAIGVARKHCWRYDWVLEFDIKGLFDNLPHDLLLKAVRKHITNKWALLYIERWLTAPMEKDGELTERTRGTPQGGVISPVLSNRFLHCAPQQRWKGQFRMT
jgi:RNA-directed DNA polymerase